jgi:hypothetical protein
MSKQINPFSFKNLLVLVICLISATSVFALSEKNQQLVTQNLAKKLQSDLANDNVTVKLNNLKENTISKKELGLTGDAVCVLTADNRQFPIAFEVKINTINQSVVDVKYDFIEAVSKFAPSQNEEILMKELMKQISRDYKTENIVIAIDGFENVGNTTGEKKFLGVGEVRIGGMVWNKIKFDVVLDAQTQKANKVVYKVEK